MEHWEFSHVSHSALGIDLASRRWADVGSAVVVLQPDGRLTSNTPAIAWPSGNLEAKELACQIDTYCRDQGIRAVGLDGPHAWKNPLSIRPGAGRWSEYLVRAQGKTCQPGHALPRTQLRWTIFCIEVFDALLAKPDVCLAQPEGMPTGCSYAVMETYPTAIWKALGLRSLPGKASASSAQVACWSQELSGRLGLQMADGIGHDDLQAVVAALPALALAGGPLRAEAHGDAVVERDHCRLEGYIWTLKSVRSVGG
jgi:hypothetical protein